MRVLTHDRGDHLLSRRTRGVLLAATALLVLAGASSVANSSGLTVGVAAPALNAGPVVATLGVPCDGAPCAPTAPANTTRVAMEPHPATLGSTPSNRLVANWSGEGMIAENPEDPLNFVAGSLYQPPSVVNNSTRYYDVGASGVYTSFDGGHTWSDSSLPTCEFHFGDTAIAFGPNSHVYYVDLGYATGQNGCPYKTLGGYNVFVTPSTDGGRTWGIPVPVRVNATVYLDKPWVAVDHATGEIYVAYTDDGSSTQVYVQNSTDDGTNWSTPLRLSNGTGDQLGVELAVDSSGAIDASWVDWTTDTLLFARSVDHGQSFSAPVVVGVAPSSGANPYPDLFRALLIPALGLDASDANGYSGRLFVVWQNGSGLSAGSPFVSLSYSDDNGSTWSKPVKVNSNESFEDLQPCVAIDPSGTVYVVWYAVDPTSGHYRLRGAVSRDGGTTFGTDFAVSDNDSYPFYPSPVGGAWWIGDYTDMVADQGGAHPLWTDARSNESWSCSSCAWGDNYNISMYTAQIVNATVTSNVATNLSVAGTVPTSGAWPVGPQPSSADWLVGQQYNLSAPPVVSENGSDLYFAIWFGSVLSNSTTLTGVVNGSFQLHACYTAVFGGVCRAPGAPGFLDIDVSAPNATARLNGQSVSLVDGRTNLTLAPGAYWVNISAPGFHGLSALEGISTANLTTVYANLTPYPGFLAGTVAPPTANVTIDGHPVPVIAVNGSFLVSLLPGTHAVVASYPLYSTYFANVTVRTNLTTDVTATLFPTWGVLTGSVIPASATATLNGRPLPMTNGSFRLELVPGTYWVNATLAGYVDGTTGPVSVTVLSTVNVEISLALAYGTLNGTVVPATAEVEFNGTPVGVISGHFSIAAHPGTYTLHASASGYEPTSLWVTIVAQSTQQMELALNESPGWIVGVVDPVEASVLVDGSAVMVASDGSFNLSVPAGSHTVKGSSPGWTTHVSTVRVTAGYATDVHLTLMRPAPTTSSVLTGPVTLGVIGLSIAVAAGVAVWWGRRRGRDPSPPDGSGSGH